MLNDDHFQLQIVHNSDDHFQLWFKHTHRSAVERANVQVEASLSLQESALDYDQNFDSELQGMLSQHGSARFSTQIAVAFLLPYYKTGALTIGNCSFNRGAEDVCAIGEG